MYNYWDVVFFSTENRLRYPGLDNRYSRRSGSLTHAMYIVQRSFTTGEEKSSKTNTVLMVPDKHLSFEQNPFYRPFSIPEDLAPRLMWVSCIRVFRTNLTSQDNYFVQSLLAVTFALLATFPDC